ncbi:MAG: rRNA adenine dimethyltransferase family protein, partial [Spirochaetota bacterium]
MSDKYTGAGQSWGSQPFCDWNPCSPKSLTGVLEGLGAAPRKRWGQNFLIDLAAQQRIVRAARIQLADHVWEIGPGLGALTAHVWGKCRSLTLFEIDPLLLQVYQTRLQGGAARLVSGDVVQTWRGTGSVPDVIISNLPYNAASLIMAEFAQCPSFRPRCMVFTVQKEMAARLTAKERSKPYSSFSVLLQSQFHIEELFDLGAGLGIVI